METLYGFCENKCKQEVYPKSNVYSKTEVDNLLAQGLNSKGEISSEQNINLLSDPGIYICSNPTTENGYPTTSAGILEVIKSSETSGHVIQRYSVDGSNITYERHVGEELGSWVKIINSGDIAVLTGDITLETSGGSTNVNYPTGFTKDNCIVVACGITYNSQGYRAFGTVQASVSTGARLNSSSITVCCYPLQASTGGPTGTYNYKLVLMKIS